MGVLKTLQYILTRCGIRVEVLSNFRRELATGLFQSQPELL